MLQKLTCTIALAMLAACSRSSPRPEPLPRASGESPARTTETPTATRSWSFIRDSTPHRYSTVTMTHLELRGDTGTTTEAFETSTDFTLAFFGESAPVRISGVIEAMRLDRGTRTKPEDNQPFQPFSFSGRIENGALALDSAGGSVFQTITACNKAGLNAVTALNRSVVILPLSITTGMTWTDSSTTSGCSGSIPVQLTAIRSYRVIGETREAGPGKLAVDRTDRVTANGEGSQGQHRVMLQVTSSGSARILVDSRSGVLSGMDGEQKSDVIITSSGRSQHFVQTVRDRTSSRPAL